jgi:hypothetical protein
MWRNGKSTKKKSKCHCRGTDLVTVATATAYQIVQTVSAMVALGSLTIEGVIAKARHARHRPWAASSSERD